MDFDGVIKAKKSMTLSIFRVKGTRCVRHFKISIFDFSIGSLHFTLQFHLQIKAKLVEQSNKIIIQNTVIKGFY